MSTIREFEQIEAWVKSRLIVNQVYEITRTKFFCTDYSLKDQMKRAAVSIMSNIAEGFERDNNKEFIYFLSISKGSCGEVRSLAYVAPDQNYIDIKLFVELSKCLQELAKLISGLINYLKSSEIRGLRYKPETRNQKPETQYFKS
jgi:four helix bundle protein